MKTDKSVSQYAEQYAVSRTTIRRWRAEGVDLDNQEEVESWKACRRSGGGSGISPEMRAALLRKTELECQKLQLQINQQKALYVSRAETKEAAERVEKIITRELSVMVDAAVPLMAGRSELEVLQALDHQIEEAKDRIRAAILAI